MAALKIPKVPKNLRLMVAALAVFIILGFVIVMGFTIYQKASELTGLQQPVIENCTDTDNGNLQEEFGTCTDSSRQAKSDTCAFTGLKGELKLQEWFCNSTTNTCQSEIKDCNLGFVCSGGICIKT